MKGIILILGFIILNVWLFLIDEFWLLGLLSILEAGILVALSNISWHTLLRFFIKNCGFVLFVMLCNLLFSDWRQALLVGWRLSLAIGGTYIIFCILDTREFARSIATLCAPLRLFGVDTSELALSIMVALTFIPLLMYEARQLQNNLKLKGCDWKTFCHRPQLYVVGIVEQLFDYIEAAEQSLRLKGYE